MTEAGCPQSGRPTEWLETELETMKMKTKFVGFLVFFFALTLPALSALSSGAWIPFSSAEGQFSVLFPGTPEEKTQKEKNDTSHTLTLVSGQEVYIIGWTDYDPNLELGTLLDADRNRDDFMKEVKAELVSSKLIKLGNNPGMEFTSQSATRLFFSRFYVVGRRAYMMSISVLKGQEKSSSISKFLSSFKIKN